MKKLAIGMLTLALFSGCSISLPGNPDQKNFDEEYSAAPDFSAQEEKVVNGEPLSEVVTPEALKIPETPQVPKAPNIPVSPKSAKEGADPLLQMFQ